MTYGKKILRNIKITGNLPADAQDEAEEYNAELMGDARYLRQSSALINDALQKGYDVLQLASGDIVTTGTKIVVSQYSWDEGKGKLVKTKSGSTARRPRSAKSDDQEADAAVSHSEIAENTELADA